MLKFGLIGKPLTHSFSKKYFADKFIRESISDTTYDLFELKDIAELPALIDTYPSLLGLNVTIPYKQSVLPFLHHISPEANTIGAVNCIKIDKGQLIGYNTDVLGFKKSLTPLLATSFIQAFVLGTGGSSLAVRFVLEQLNIPYKIVSRSASATTLLYSEIKQHLGTNNLFINTSPVGQFPSLDSCPALPYEDLKASDILFDLVYNPTETLFLKKGKQMGCAVSNGLKMLELQAEASWEIWMQA